MDIALEIREYVVAHHGLHVLLLLLYMDFDPNTESVVACAKQSVQEPSILNLQHQVLQKTLTAALALGTTALVKFSSPDCA